MPEISNKADTFEQLQKENIALKEKSQIIERNILEMKKNSFLNGTGMVCNVPEKKNFLESQHDEETVIAGVSRQMNFT